MIIPLRYQWGLMFLAWMVFIPLSQSLALRAWDSPWYCFLLWPLSHASILHLAINAYAWLWQWPLVTPARLAAAYLVSLLAGLFHLLLPHHLPLLGFSGVIFFFIGLSAPVRPLKSLTLTLIFLLLPLFLFNTIAASVHIFCFFVGFLYYKILLWQRKRTV